MHKLTLKEIQEYRTRDLIAGLRNRKFSLLKSMGFHKLRAGMIATGLACRLLVFLTGLHGAVRRAGPHGIRLNDSGRLRTARFLRAVMPVDLYGVFPHPNNGMVVGFNHPSLGEILRFIYICMVEYKHQRNLFPVNLPWYEALMPIVGELEAIGIYIMPIITPSTRSKMARTADEETMHVIDDLAKSFNLVYLEECVEFIKLEDNIWVAPSATRQPTLFKTIAAMNGDEKIEPQTMTLLATALVRSKVEKCSFLATAVVPPQGFKRGLNPFRTYKIGAGKTMTIEQARDTIRKRCEKNSGRQFEMDFLMNIAIQLIHTGGSSLICPDT